MNDENTEVGDDIPLQVRAQEKKPNPFTRDVKFMLGGLWDSVILPALQTTVTEAVNVALDMFLYGNNRQPTNRGHRIDYRSSSHGSYRGSTNRAQRVRYSGFQLREAYFSSRREAEVVLRDLNSDLVEYGSVTCGSYYSLIGFNAEMVADSYGWSDLSGVRVIGNQNHGYSLNLPKPRRLS